MHFRRSSPPFSSQADERFLNEREEALQRKQRAADTKVTTVYGWSLNIKIYLNLCVSAGWNRHVRLFRFVRLALERRQGRDHFVESALERTGGRSDKVISVNSIHSDASIDRTRITFRWMLPDSPASPAELRSEARTSVIIGKAENPSGILSSTHVFLRFPTCFSYLSTTCHIIQPRVFLQFLGPSSRRSSFSAACS